MNNPLGFQPPTNNQEIPQEKNNKIPPKSHSLSQAKMVSCLQLQSTTL